MKCMPGWRSRFAHIPGCTRKRLKRPKDAAHPILPDTPIGDLEARCRSLRHVIPCEASIARAAQCRMLKSNFNANYSGSDSPCYMRYPTVRPLCPAPKRRTFTNGCKLVDRFHAARRCAIYGEAFGTGII